MATEEQNESSDRREAASTSDPYSVGRSTLFILSGLGGAVGLFASGAQVIDYAQNNTSLLFFFLGGLLIFLPFGVAFDYLRRHGQRAALPYIALAFALVSAGVFTIVATANTSSTPETPKGETAGHNTQNAARDRCKAVPDVKLDPSRLRSCDSLILESSAGDLDSTDVAWGNPGASLTKAADIDWSGSSNGLQVSEKGFIAAVPAPASYASCKAQTVWSSRLASWQAADSGQACVITDQGRMAALFWNTWDSAKADFPPTRLEVFVIVWNKS